MHASCPICQELFNANDEINVTPCGHMFHLICLMQWLETSLTCPSCRHKCLQSKVIRLYPNISLNESSTINTAQDLLAESDNLKLEIRKSNIEKIALKKDIEENQKVIASLKKKLKNSKQLIQTLEETHNKHQILMKILRDEITNLKSQNKNLSTIEKELSDAKEKISLMENIQQIISCSTKDVEELLKNRVNHECLATMVVSLKRELQLNEKKKSDLRNNLKSSQHESHQHQLKIKELQEKIHSLESDNFKLTDDLKTLEKKKHKINDETLHLSPIEPKKLEKIKSTSMDGPSSSASHQPVSLLTAEMSDSPYLHIKASSVGLSPLLKRKRLAPNRLLQRFASLGNREEFSIFKPRLTETVSRAKPLNNFIIKENTTTDTINNNKKSIKRLRKLN